MDEMSNFLDEQNKRQIVENIHDHFKNKIVIMVSHDMDVLNYSDKIYELQDKKLNLVNNKVMKQYYLHIGFHKTGSKFIQKIF